MNTIKIDPERKLGNIDHNIFGGFAEHVGHCIYGGIFDEGSFLSDKLGLRCDVLKALRRLGISVIRYPGGNFASGYHWRDGIGPRNERPPRLDLAWGAVESNRFGTDEFIQFCHQVGAEPYLVVNCGDGSLREARDWVEYCNGTQDTALVRLRHRNGFNAPHRVKYWGIGNEVDDMRWQIGAKTPQEYARTFHEFGKAMKRVDPEIKLIASGTCTFNSDFVERGQLILEQDQARHLVDYMGLHWYVGNDEDNFPKYMAVSEDIEEMLSAYEGLINAMRLAQHIKREIFIAVDEWNVYYRSSSPAHDEVYNLEDALVVAMHFNAFIRHARSVRMANMAQIVNVIAPIVARPDGLLLQSIFYPFEIYSRECGDVALDVFWSGDTFSGGNRVDVRILDVAATFDTSYNQVALFVVNRSLEPAETEIILQAGQFVGPVWGFVINGPDIKAYNSIEQPNVVARRPISLSAKGDSLVYVFEPHSVTALKFKVN